MGIGTKVKARRGWWHRELPGDQEEEQAAEGASTLPGTGHTGNLAHIQWPSHVG